MNLLARLDRLSSAAGIKRDCEQYPVQVHAYWLPWAALEQGPRTFIGFPCRCWPSSHQLQAASGQPSYLCCTAEMCTWQLVKWIPGAVAGQRCSSKTCESQCLLFWILTCANGGRLWVVRLLLLLLGKEALLIATQALPVRTQQRLPVGCRVSS